MSKTYVIVDANNLFMRIRFGSKAPDIDSQVGLAMHLVFTSIKKVWKDLGAEHLIVALEGRSWRRDFYTPYKAHRRAAAAERSPREVEEDKVFFEAIDDFIQFLTNKTNCTVLRHPNAEADDMIARWIDLHPDDNHVIVSSDSDFQQLLAPNVKIYNGISALLYTIDGVWDKDGKIARNSRGEEMTRPDPQWLLFEKIIRGDASDNVMSAYPGVRKKRMEEAFENRETQGYAWNNLMLSSWTDHNGEEFRVRDVYERNRVLIDLRAQPTELVEKFDDTIRVSVNRTPRGQVGVALMRFTNQWGLVKIERAASDYAPCFSTGYTGPLLETPK